MDVVVRAKLRFSQGNTTTDYWCIVPVNKRRLFLFRSGAFCSIHHVYIPGQNPRTDSKQAATIAFCAARLSKEQETFARTFSPQGLQQQSLCFIHLGALIFIWYLVFCTGSTVEIDMKPTRINVSQKNSVARRSCRPKSNPTPIPSIPTVYLQQ